MGSIPEAWGNPEFFELYAEPSRNGVYKTSDYHGRGVPIVNMGEMFGFEFISDQEMNRVELNSRELTLSEIKDGDLLFGRRSVVPSGAGKCSLVVDPSEPTTFESSIIRVRLDKNSADPLFFYYFFASPTGRSLMAGIISGTNVKGIRATELKTLKIYHPPLFEQRVIAAALADADALVSALEGMIAKKRDLRQAAMQHLLAGKTRLPGFSVEWELKRLGDHVRFLKNGTLSRAELANDAPVKYLHYGDIHGSDTLWLHPNSADMPCVVPALVEVLDRLEDGDLIFADASEDLAGVGKSIEIADCMGTEVVSGLHTIAARFDKAVLVDGFKAYLQFMPPLRQHLRSMAAGTKVLATNRKHIASATLALPEPLEQTAIAEVLSDMDADLAAQGARLTKARAVKHGMAQQLLTGRVRLV